MIKKEPIPGDAIGRNRWAWGVAQGTAVRKLVTNDVLGMLPADRIAELFPKGIMLGVNLAVEAAQAQGLKVPTRIADHVDAFAEGLALGMPLPAKTSVGRGIENSCVRTIRIGIAQGIIETFRAIGLREAA